MHRARTQKVRRVNCCCTEMELLILKELRHTMEILAITFLSPASVHPCKKALDGDTKRGVVYLFCTSFIFRFFVSKLDDCDIENVFVLKYMK
jgi:hypothetical protein